MTRSIAVEIENPNRAEARSSFRSAAERVMQAEARYGWLQAFNLQGSGGLAKLGPIVMVVVAAFAGSHHAGTLVALYLLAQRTFWGFDGIIDLSLGSKTVRGAVARCFRLIDTSPVDVKASSLSTAA